MAEKRVMQFKVLGEDPLQAGAPLFSNFVAISHLGREVQLEFIFLDIAQVAQHFENSKGQDANQEPPTFQGKTVAKLVTIMGLPPVEAAYGRHFREVGD